MAKPEPMITIDVPNLDACDRSDLAAYEAEVNRRIDQLSHLSHYLHHAYRAKLRRTVGDIDMAKTAEYLADLAYSQLPEDMKW